MFAGLIALVSGPAMSALPPVSNRTPVAVEDRLTLVGITGSINVLVNDRDADGDRLSLVDVESAQGTVAFTTDGLLTYLADPKTGGEDELYYTVADGRGGIAIGIVRLQKE